VCRGGPADQQRSIPGNGPWSEGPAKERDAACDWHRAGHKRGDARRHQRIAALKAPGRCPPPATLHAERASTHRRHSVAPMTAEASEREILKRSMTRPTGPIRTESGDLERDLVGEFVVAGDDVMAQRQCSVPVEHPFQLGCGERLSIGGHDCKRGLRVGSAHANARAWSSPARAPAAAPGDAPVAGGAPASAASRLDAAPHRAESNHHEPDGDRGCERH
jgi:hypothetical protein